jgi:hypothetical protein
LIKKKSPNVLKIKIPMAAANPSIPSRRLIALIIPTINMMVTMKDATSLNGSIPKSPKKYSKRMPAMTIKTATTI